MIEDAELRNLFNAESSEHIQALTSALLSLEKEPEAVAFIDEALRSAHSLKGASRMLGLKDIELISHRVEGVFASAKKKELTLTPEVIDCVYRALDAVKALVKEATSGEKAGVSVSGIVEGLSTCASGKKEEAGDAPSAVHNEPKDAIKPEAFEIDTVRVDTKRLDEIMNSVGELLVMKTRLGHDLSLAGEAVDLYEQMRKSPPGGLLEGPSKEFSQRLSSLRDRLFEDSSMFESALRSIDGHVREIRLVPFSVLFNLFPRMARDLLREAGKEARLDMIGAETTADKRVIEEMKDPLMHLIRNAVDHGIEAPSEREGSGKGRAGLITIKAERREAGIVIEVSDDGRGIDVEAVKRTALKRRLVREETAVAEKEAMELVFRPGFSTSSFVTDTSGRGVGLDVVRNNVERLKGTIDVSSKKGLGATFTITLPATLATIRAFIAVSEGRSFAVPVEAVKETRMVPLKDVFTVEGRPCILVDRSPVPVMRLMDILGFKGFKAEKGEGQAEKDSKSPCMILHAQKRPFGVLVDDIAGEEELLLKPRSSLIKRVPNISGSTILGTGGVTMVLNPEDLLKAVEGGGGPAKEGQAPKGLEKEERKVVLLAEDSITTRTQEKRILEGGGYEVVTAVDGLDALQKLSARRFDAVISDILMPNMDGLTLTQRIREDKKYRDIPVILVTTLASDEDKKRGLAAGADAYIPKPSFDQKMLLDALRRLI